MVRLRFLILLPLFVLASCNGGYTNSSDIYEVSGTSPASNVGDSAKKTLEFAVTSPSASAAVFEQRFEVKGTCDPKKGDIVIDVENSEIETESKEVLCSEESNTFSFEADFANKHQWHKVKISQGEQTLESLWLWEFFAAYCGNGVVDQAWELTDDEESDETCKKRGTKDPRKGLVLMAIEYTATDTRLAGKAFPVTYLGQAEKVIPSKAYFALQVNGQPVYDSEGARSFGYSHDVVGLSVSRIPSKGLGAEVLAYGTYRGKNRGLAHWSGKIRTYSTDEQWQLSHFVNPRKDKLERQGDGKKAGAGQDEVWLEKDSDGNVIGNFWVTATTANDAFEPHLNKVETD